MPILNMIYGGGSRPKPPIDGMLAYYLLEANANDTKADFGATGTTYNASWVGSSSYTTLGGKATATFNNSDYISTGITAGSGPITIACMFYSTWTTGYRTVIGSPLSWKGSSNPHICCAQIYTDGSAYFWYGRRSTESNLQSLTMNAWHFMAIRIDSNGNAKMDLDSTQLTATTNSFTINESIYIGAGVGNKFNGGVKCVGIWNKSLSDEELQQYKGYLDSL